MALPKLPVHTGLLLATAQHLQTRVTFIVALAYLTANHRRYLYTVSRQEDLLESSTYIFGGLWSEGSSLQCPAVITKVSRISHFDARTSAMYGSCILVRVLTLRYALAETSAKSAQLPHPLKGSSLQSRELPMAMKVWTP